MSVQDNALAQSLPEFIASLPTCPPDFFVDRYRHLNFDWFPYMSLTRPGGSPFSNGFSKAVMELLSNEDFSVIGAFFRALYEATLQGKGYHFMRSTFGPHPTITLREARVNAGLSQHEAARAADISVRTLRRWERLGAHHATYALFKRLLQVYRVSFDRVSLDPDVAENGGEVSA